MESTSGQKKAKALKRLEVVEAFRQSGNRPEWMILDVIPVIPPEIRPMVQLEGADSPPPTLTTFTDALSTETAVLQSLWSSAPPR